MIRTLRRTTRESTRAFAVATSIALAMSLLASCTSLRVVSAWLNDQVAFTAPQLQHAMEKRFPRKFDKLGGLVSVSLEHPQLTIPPGAHRLRIEFDIGIGGLGGKGAPTGHLALTSALRYDTSTQGLHLDQPQLLQLDLPGAGSLLRGGARALVNQVLSEDARSEPVYRLDPHLLEKLPPGRRIGAVDIEDSRVVVHLVR